MRVYCPPRAGRSTSSLFTNPAGRLRSPRCIIMNEVPLEHLTAERFAELVQTPFQVSGEPGLVVNLELAAITVTRPDTRDDLSPGGPMSEGFSLLFNGPANPPLAQRMYGFAHERLGSFDLFIVPVSAAGELRQYEAVLNRRPVPEKGT